MQRPSPKILIERLDKELPLPKYAKPGDAGFDIYSRVDLTLKAGERTLVPTGLSIALPPGYVAFVHPRSGLAIKNGISLVNTPFTYPFLTFGSDNAHPYVTFFFSAKSRT